MDVDEGSLNIGKNGTEFSTLENYDLHQEETVEAENVKCDLSQPMLVEGACSDKDRQIERDIAQSDSKLYTVNLASECISSAGLAASAATGDDVELNAECDKVLWNNGTKPSSLHTSVAGYDDLNTEITGADLAVKETVTVALLSDQDRCGDVCENIAVAVNDGPSSLTHFDELIDDNGIGKFQANVEGKYRKCLLQDNNANSYSDCQRNLGLSVNDSQRNVVSVEIHGVADESILCSAAEAGTNQCEADDVCLHTGNSPVISNGHYCSKMSQDEGHSQEIILNSDYTVHHSPMSESTAVISSTVINSEDRCVELDQRCDLDAEPLCKSSSVLERRGSRGSIERFLAPSVPANKAITTPVDDPGFSKIPGYASELALMEEEDLCSSECAQLDRLTVENTDSNAKLSDSSGRDEKLNRVNEGEQVVMRTENTGARTRTSRPNSLLGLSKPVVTLSDTCKDAQQSDDRTEANTPVVNKTETDTVFGLLRPRQRPVLLTVSSDKGRPNSLLLSQRPMSWSPAAVALQPTSTNTSKRPCSLNLPMGLSQETVTRNSGPTETKCRRTVRGDLQSSVPGRSEVLPPVVVATVPTVQSSSTELYSAQPTALGLSSVQSPRLTPTSVPSVAPDRVSVSEMVAVTELSPSQSAMPLSQHHPEIVSISSAAEGSLPLNSSTNVSICDLGKVAPVWVPDASASRCMHCDCRFTFTRRRHHCRACGKVFCSTCCSIKAKLCYLGKKEARVCSQCHVDLLRANLLQRVGTQHPQTAPSTPLSFGSPEHVTTPQRTAAAVPSGEVFISAAETARQADADLSRRLRMAGTVDDLSVRRKEQQARMLSPGIAQRSDIYRQGRNPDHCVVDGMLTSEQFQCPVAAASDRTAMQPSLIAGRPKCGTLEVSDSQSTNDETTMSLDLCRSTAPAIITGCSRDQPSQTPCVPCPVKLNGVSHDNKSADICSGAVPLQVELGANLLVYISLVTLDCCVHRRCWCFTTRGLCTVGQHEAVIVLEQLPQEDDIPSDVLVHILALYNRAAQGNVVCDLDYVAYEDNLFGRKENAGFLYLRPTYQCLQGFTVPQTPFLVAILILQSEVAWAKILPLRLLLRLGSEHRYYPCPLVSVRDRRPVYRDLGRTVMKLLATGNCRLSRVAGLHVFMENRKTFIVVPNSSRNEMVSALDNCMNDHTIAIEAEFSEELDSYLVSVQTTDGRYHTQAIKIDSRCRSKTGACFIAFNVPANQKTSRAHCSIVEDGILVRLPRNTFDALRNALHTGENFSITDSESVDAAGSRGEELVVVQWIDDTALCLDVNERCAVDRQLLTKSRHHRVCYEAANPTPTVTNATRLLFLRCTDIYYITDNVNLSLRTSEFQQSVAQLCCSVLNPSLAQFNVQPAASLEVRISLHQSVVACTLHVDGLRCDSGCIVVLESQLTTLLQGIVSHTDHVTVILFVFYVVRQAI